MFWIAPIHTPNIPVRRSPKYFHVSESGPSGSVGRSAVARRDAAAVFVLVLELAVMMSSLSVNPRVFGHDRRDNTRCPQPVGASDA
jgi:hypothetical protein